MLDPDEGGVLLEVGERVVLLRVEECVALLEDEVHVVSLALRTPPACSVRTQSIQKHRDGYVAFDERYNMMQCKENDRQVMQG